MPAFEKLGGCVALVGLPVLVCALWLASGREVVSKSGKAMQVEVANPLFGDTTVETQFKPGPVLGYYVGFDLVVVSTLGAATLGLIWWLLARRRRRTVQPHGGTKA